MSNASRSAGIQSRANAWIERHRQPRRLGVWGRLLALIFGGVEMIGLTRAEQAHIDAQATVGLASVTKWAADLADEAADEAANPTMEHYIALPWSDDHDQRQQCIDAALDELTATRHVVMHVTHAVGLADRAASSQPRLGLSVWTRRKK